MEQKDFDAVAEGEDGALKVLDHARDVVERCSHRFMLLYYTKFLVAVANPNYMSSICDLIIAVSLAPLYFPIKSTVSFLRYLNATRSFYEINKKNLF